MFKKKIIFHVGKLEILKNSGIQKDFTFICNNNRFQCPKTLALLFSRSVRLLNSTNPTISEFTIAGNAPETIFRKCMDYMYGGKLQIELDEVPFLLQVFLSLGNEDIYQEIRIYEEIITIENVCDRLICNQNQNIIPFRDFISENFFQIDHNDLMKIPFEIMDEILSSQKLTISIENNLFIFLKNYCKTSFSKKLLFKHIQSGFLEQQELEEYLSILEKEELILSSWENIKNHLKNLKLKNEILETNRRILKKFLYNNEKFDGVFWWLTKNFGGNPHDNNIINLSVSSKRADNIPQNIFEPAKTIFVSEDRSNQWIRIKFNNTKFQLTGYSLQSQDKYDNDPKSWEITGSNDSNN